MNSLTLKTILLLTLLIVLGDSALLAQKRGVVIDETTFLPIAHVNIYTPNTENVRATISNRDGLFVIDFDFQQIEFSHINYGRVVFEKSEISDTVFLTPTTTLIPEVTISVSRPDWIQRKLREVVRERGGNYQIVGKDFAYQYVTRSLSDTTGYVFRSTGVLRIPTFSGSEQYFIEPKENVIQYRDTTAGTDFHNLRRILHDDFIQRFDNRFIRNHQFSQNRLFEREDSNLVQLFFSNRRDNDVFGYIVLDTLMNVIIEAEHQASTDYNIQTRTDWFLRNFAGATAGLSFDTFETMVRFTYRKAENGSFYLSEARYRLVQETTTNQSHYFNSTETLLHVGEETEINTAKMLVLPEARVLTAIYTRRMREEDEALQNVSKTWEGF